MSNIHALLVEGGVIETLKELSKEPQSITSIVDASGGETFEFHYSDDLEFEQAFVRFYEATASIGRQLHAVTGNTVRVSVSKRDIPPFSGGYVVVRIAV